MAEQGRTVTPTVVETGTRGRLTGNRMKLCNSPSTPSYDSGKPSFTSYLGRPSRSGFTSNQRPAVYYRPSLDHTDNPQLGLLLSDSFMSQTKRHYQPPSPYECSVSLPNLVNRAMDSGFHQLRSHPKTEADVEKTEYQKWFVPHRLAPAVAQCHVTMGTKEESGFTEGKELQFNTFLEKNCSTVEPRFTPSSVTKGDFVPPSFLQGTEPTPGLRSQACRETGFTRGVIAPLACPSSLLPSPHKSSPPTVMTIGKKEPTGSLLNTPNKQAFPNRPFDHSHFTTHYRSKFCHRADLEKLKSDRNCAGIISAKTGNGYNGRDMDRFIFKG
ncbi:protein phosphatase 1 regulatory subunit 32 [Mugil cephalus]|uniref:protein phosphatase 1 regulatory subunit 32 n=1 Tax=Mugil cephalus TaxID=48193 RepID=UPI001FB5AB0E|nr:protein phosphatase 1 regulatory subunit 32 [Mugil cephalus]